MQFIEEGQSDPTQHLMQYFFSGHGTKHGGAAFIFSGTNSQKPVC